jgi:hypothetical protein
VVDIFDGVPAKEISKLVFKMGQRELQVRLGFQRVLVLRHQDSRQASS